MAILLLIQVLIVLVIVLVPSVALYLIGQVLGQRFILYVALVPIITFAVLAVLVPHRPNALTLLAVLTFVLIVLAPSVTAYLMGRVLVREGFQFSVQDLLLGTLVCAVMLGAWTGIMRIFGAGDVAWSFDVTQRACWSPADPVCNRRRRAGCFTCDAHAQHENVIYQLLGPTDVARFLPKRSGPIFPKQSTPSDLALNDSTHEAKLRVRERWQQWIQ